MSWYVLQVLTGLEDQIKDTLIGKGVHAAVPHELRVLRSGGRWLEREYVVIPSYVFVRIDYTDALYYVLKGTHGVIRLLKDGIRPASLLPEEEGWIRNWEKPLPPSKVCFARNGTYEIIGGPLAGNNVKLLKIDRHRRRAKVEINILGKPKIAYLSLDILKDL